MGPLISNTLAPVRATVVLSKQTYASLHFVQRNTADSANTTTAAANVTHKIWSWKFFEFSIRSLERSGNACDASIQSSWPHVLQQKIAPNDNNKIQMFLLFNLGKGPDRKKTAFG